MRNYSSKLFVVDLLKTILLFILCLVIFIPISSYANTILDDSIELFSNFSFKSILALFTLIVTLSIFVLSIIALIQNNTKIRNLVSTLLPISIGLYALRYCLLINFFGSLFLILFVIYISVDLLIFRRIIKEENNNSNDRTNFNIIRRIAIVSVISVVSAVVIVPSYILLSFTYIFSQEMEVPEDFNNINRLYGKFNVVLPEDVETKYVKTEIYDSIFSDGGTYCVYTLTNDDVGIKWNGEKDNVFENEYKRNVKDFEDRFKREDEDFYLEYEFNFDIEYKWYFAGVEFSSEEWSYNVKENTSYGEELYMIYVESTNTLYTYDCNL